MAKQYKVSEFFNTSLEEENGEQKLVIYHMEGCQTLDFSEATTLPRQTEVLTALKVLGAYFTDVYGLQCGGRNKYIT
ncbi:hypothetical protein ACJMK2_043652 [Sinanodonta woodiana]|uniref:Uncharacterized protein n=1 Tax=Sinanodonta woodiana TaxID=1069815 RepID=A0ABD3W0S1_SINWO